MKLLLLCAFDEFFVDCEHAKENAEYADEDDGDNEQYNHGVDG